MWQEIEEKYPNEFKKWVKYYKGNYTVTAITMMHRQDFQSLWGWILEFFDSKNIQIEIAMSCVITWQYDLIEIKNKSAERIHDGYEYLASYSGFKSRQEAQQAATLKAFEILNNI